MSKRSIRRSSTSRSIGNRSDFTPSINGDTPATESVVEDELREGGQLDDHVSNYVESQMNRVKSQASMGTYEDEFETEADRNGFEG